MVIGIAKSIAGVKIRLTQERWNHIITSHLEIDPKNFKAALHVVRNPDVILKGGDVVVYKEVTSKGGFIVTAYLTTDSNWLFKREIIWNKE